MTKAKENAQNEKPEQHSKKLKTKNKNGRFKLQILHRAVFQFVGFCLILLAIVIAWQSQGLWQEYSEKSESSAFFNAVNSDLIKIQKNKNMKSIFNQVAEVQIKPLSRRAQQWINLTRFPLRQNFQGKLRVEVSIDHYLEKDKVFAIVQYHFVDLDSRNTYTEFARTLQLPKQLLPQRTSASSLEK